jgi:hypothetical protein
LVAGKITPQTLKNFRMTQTNLEIAGSARFFRSLLEAVIRKNERDLQKDLRSSV